MLGVVKWSQKGFFMIVVRVTRELSAELRNLVMVTGSLTLLSHGITAKFRNCDPKL